MKPFLLHQLLVDAAARTPEALALIEPKRSLSYRELERTSAQLAAALSEAGVEPGACVGLWSEKTAAGVAGVYGGLRRGAALSCQKYNCQEQSGQNRCSYFAIIGEIFFETPAQLLVKPGGKLLRRTGHLCATGSR